MHGNNWTWSGDDTLPPFEEWVRLQGQTHCETVIQIRAMPEAVPVEGHMIYSWGGIVPCPKVPPGCAACESYPCGINKTAVCDGTQTVSCVDENGQSSGGGIGLPGLPSLSMPDLSGAEKAVEGA